MGTFFLEISPDKGVDSDKLQLNVIPIVWYPATLGQHLDHNAVFLKQSLQKSTFLKHHLIDKYKNMSTGNKVTYN